MFFIWRGFGFLVPIIVFGSFLVMSLVSDNLGEGAYVNLIGTIMSVCLVALLGYKVNVKQSVSEEEQHAEMVASGSKRNMRLFTGRRHTLFFIPIQYWSVIIAVTALWIYQSNINAQEDTKTYLLTPKVGDVYIVDYETFIDGYKDDLSVSAWKITQISESSIVFIMGDYVYDSAYDTKKAVRKGGVFPLNVIDEDLRVETIESTQTLYSEKGILRIIRKDS